MYPTCMFTFEKKKLAISKSQLLHEVVKIASAFSFFKNIPHPETFHFPPFFVVAVAFFVVREEETTALGPFITTTIAQATSVLCECHGYRRDHHMYDSMQTVAKNGLQERFKDIFSNGRYNKDMILSHAEINLLIFKWRREGKKKTLHRPIFGFDNNTELL